jgi:hypothetical protein
MNDYEMILNVRVTVQAKDYREAREIAKKELRRGDFDNYFRRHATVGSGVEVSTGTVNYPPNEEDED